MATEFEQTKRDFSGRSILITSWYDEQKKNWRASAPGYAHVRALSVPERGMCASRKAAIDRIVTLLTTHFADKKTVATEHVLFL